MNYIKNTKVQKETCLIDPEKRLSVLINTDRVVESKLIKEYFKEKSCQFVVDHKYYNKQFPPKHYYFQWAHYYWNIDFKSFKDGQQIASHIPNANIYDEKNYLLQLLRNLDTKKIYKFNSLLFHPESYIFDISNSQITAEEAQLFSLENKKENYRWIAKNPRGCCGKGIRLVNDLNQFIGEIKTLKDYNGDKKHFRYKQIQRYLDKPLLINGKKAEYRAYVLIASTKPFLVLFHKGFIKTALANYTLDFNVREAHLTNLAEARKHNEYEQIKQEAYLNVEQFETFLKEKKNFTQDKIDHFYDTLKRILTYTFVSGLNVIDRKVGLFDTYAIDIFLDDDITPYLLEVNQPYAVEGADLPGYREVLPEFFKSSIDLILQINKEPSQIENIIRNQKDLILGKYMEVIINQANKYDYLQQAEFKDYMMKKKALKFINKLKNRILKLKKKTSS